MPVNASCAMAPPSSTHEPRPDAAPLQLLDGGVGRRTEDLLVAAERQPDVLRPGVKSPLEQGLDRLADPDQAALVVEGAAAPDLPVDDVAAERVVLPGALDRYDVEVGHQHDRPLAARPAPVEEQAVRVHPGQLEPLVQQRELARELGDELVERRGVDPLGLAVGDGRDADQRLQLRDRAALAAR